MDKVWSFLGFDTTNKKIALKAKNVPNTPTLYDENPLMQMDDKYGMSASKSLYEKPSDKDLKELLLILEAAKGIPPTKV
jgi:hypothetical protein